MELELCVQKYDWGKLGNESIVAKLANANTGVAINDNETYAELWLGVHPNGPSRLKSDKALLADFVKNNQDVLGLKTVESFGDNFPYLFKVLSIRKALSIQAHPAKAHAELLFKKHPELYKDPNHKPELAIALTEFEALCGFKPLLEIEKAVRNIPELKSLLGETVAERFLNGTKTIRDCFTALMTCNPNRVASLLDSILSRVSTLDQGKLLSRLNSQFPHDVGVFCVFFLNHVILQPGEALYLGPNEPHAYLSGDCMECMANSDNVVRAGLTPKLRDVTTLCEMLTYKSYEREEVKFKPEVEDSFSLLFRPPVNDFAVVKITLPAGVKYTLKKRNSASIILALDGKSSASSRFGVIAVTSGVALFLPAEDLISFETDSEQTLYQALCNV